MKALVIDDSRAMRMVMTVCLKKLGFVVAEAGNGREALAYLGDHGAPDVAMVDWNMPVMGGREFVQAVRADGRYAGLRLVMVTTETEADQVPAARAAGVNEVVMKPFTPDGLREKLGLIGLAVA